VKVGDVIQAKYRTMEARGRRRKVLEDLDLTTGSPEFPARGMYWLGVVHAVRDVGRGKKARRRNREVDVLWGDGTLTTEVGPGTYLKVLTEEVLEARGSDGSSWEG